MRNTISICAICVMWCVIPLTVSAVVIRPAPINGLVGYWSFDSGAMGTTSAQDLSGRNNTGWLMGGVAKVIGKLGQALSFNGTSRYVNMGNVADLGIGDATIVAWIKPTNVSQASQIICKRQNDGGYPMYTLSVGSTVGSALNSSKKISAMFNDRYEVCSGTTQAYRTTNDVVDGNWHHVVTVRKSGIAPKIYIDGVDSAVTSACGSSGNTNVNTTNTAQFGVGACVHGGPLGLYNGLVDDVRIYNRALSASEVSSLYKSSGVAKTNTSSVGAVTKTVNLTSGLVGYWTFDGKNMGTTSAMDLTINRNIGWLAGGVKKVAGKIGQGLKLDGSSGYLNSPDGFTNTIKADDTHTISLWVYTSANPTTKVVMDVRQTSHAQGGFLEFNNTSGFFWGWGGTYRTYSATSFELNKWNNLVFVKTGSGDSGDFYINGVVQQTYSGTMGSVPDESSDIYWGRYRNSLYFNGTLDDVRIYNRALSAAEVTALYHLGSGGKQNTSSVGAVTKTVNLTSGLVSYWTFDGKNMGTTSAMDLTTNRNTGWFIGGVKKVAGKIGQGLKFDGTSSSVIIGSTSILNATVAKSVFAWIKPNVNSTSAYGRIILSDIVGSRWTLAQCSNGGSIPNAVGGTPNNNGAYGCSGAGTVPVGAWSFVGWTFDGSTYNIYVNGSLMSQNTVDGTFGFSDTGYNKIGYAIDAYGNGKYNGLIDDVRIYNRALSAAEVTALYRMGK